MLSGNAGRNSEYNLKYLTPTEGMQWYCCRTHSGCESRTRLDLQVWSFYLDLTDSFGMAIIPLELVLVSKKLKHQKLYPGFIFLEMILNMDTFQLVKNLPKVQLFGADEGTPPPPIAPTYIDAMLEHMIEGHDVEKPILFEAGDPVVIVGGPLEGFSGIVRTTSPRLQVSLSIMGRQVTTSIEAGFVKRVGD